MPEDTFEPKENIIQPKPSRWPKLLAICFSVLLVIVLASIFMIRRTYLEEILPLSTSTDSQLVTIASGSTTAEIAELLEEKQLIKSAWAFEWHVRSREIRNQLQAGTYKLSPSMGVPTIVELFIEGKIDTTTITILPGTRVEQVKKAFVRVGFPTAAVDQGFIAAQYHSHPALVDKPLDASLEGYLYPDTFSKDTNTEPSDVINSSLDEMSKKLTPELKQAFAAQGLTTHQAVTLASIIEQEVPNDIDRPIVAQVFLKRLREGVRLESDATGKYGETYNTYKHDGLPPGPISNVTLSSLKAVANPANTDWLYFVSGDPDENGSSTTYFSKTLAEHQALTKQHCKKLCSGQ